MLSSGVSSENCSLGSNAQKWNCILGLHIFHQTQLQFYYDERCSCLGHSKLGCLYYTDSPKFLCQDTTENCAEHSPSTKYMNNFFQRGVQPEITVGVFKELIRRGSLNPALAGRNSTKLLPVLIFITRSVPHDIV